MNLVPNAVLTSVTDITPEWMDSRGLKALLLDLDNTLAPYREVTPSNDIREWLEHMSGYRLVVFSNAKERRVAEFCVPLGLTYVAKAGKPKPQTAADVCKYLGMLPSEAAIVGDQIFTDVLCANNAGLMSVIVEPVKKGKLVNFRRNILESRHIKKGKMTAKQ